MQPEYPEIIEFDDESSDEFIDGRSNLTDSERKSKADKIANKDQFMPPAELLGNEPGLVVFQDEDIIITQADVSKTREEVDTEVTVLNYIGYGKNKVGQKLLVECNYTEPHIENGASTKFIVNGWVCVINPNSSKHTESQQKTFKIAEEFHIETKDLVILGKISEIWGSIEETYYTISLPTPESDNINGFDEAYKVLHQDIIGRLCTERLPLFVYKAEFETAGTNSDNDEECSDD